ncbi:hypothetical protein HID58_075313, partial [Brassica napus]
RHPNTIAYPEKYFESAQAITAHSHLRWTDLSREWIRRQQARIARVDWESRLPCVLGQRKSRLPLFTRKQQRLFGKAKEMDGVPDLSALLKGKLQLLSKKSTTVDPQGTFNSGVDGTSEGGGTSREGASKRASREGGPIAVDQGGSKEKKKKDRKKRSRGGAASSVDRGESLAEGQEAVLVGTAPDGHPKKRTKRSVEAEPRPSTSGATRPSTSGANAADATLVDAVGEASGTPKTPSEERRKTSSREGGSGGEPERSAPDSSARQRSRSEGSVAKRRRIEFPDRVEFSYDETTPLILNPLRWAELTRQIRGGTKEKPQLEDLYFKNEYIDAASSRARHVEVPEGGGLEEVPGRENLEADDTPIREEETKSVGIEDPVLVLGSSSEGREDEEEEDDRFEETSPPQPVEEETANEVGDGDVQKPSSPAVDFPVPVPTRVEDSAAAATEDPNISQIFEYRCVIVLVVRRQGLLREYNLNAPAVSWLLFVG